MHLQVFVNPVERAGTHSVLHAKLLTVLAGGSDASVKQYNSSEGHVGGNQWSSNSHEVAVASAMQQGANPPTTEEEEAARRDRLSTL